jgi:hypothetical protein
MLLSLGVILAFVAVWVALVPRVNKVSQPPVDVLPVAKQVARETGWAIEAPTLPAGWRANAVRFERSTDGLQTWHAGYISPDEQYIAIEQTRGATATWVAAQTNRGRAEGTLTAAGRTWEKIRRGDKVQISLVNRGKGAKDMTTILTGTAPYDELVAFAERLRPVSAG